MTLKQQRLKVLENCWLSLESEEGRDRLSVSDHDIPVFEKAEEGTTVKGGASLTEHNPIARCGRNADKIQ